MKETKERGITLIALIITVIVMLILAGVAINLTIGDNGIFRKSDEGAQIYKNAANDEASSLNDVEGEMGNLINQYYGGNEDVLEDFKKNPDKYTHPDQSNTNGDRAIGTDGKAVNLDLWKWRVISGTITLNDGRQYAENGYANENVVNGKIQGTVPQYIYVEADNKVYTVTSMAYTFSNCTNLVEAPELPDTVTDMMYTFERCEKLEKGPEIPSGVVSIRGSFENCTNMKSVRINAKNVSNMDVAFVNINNVTVQVPANSATYDLITVRYGSSQNITIETF